MKDGDLLKILNMVTDVKNAVHSVECTAEVGWRPERKSEGELERRVKREEQDAP